MLLSLLVNNKPHLKIVVKINKNSIIFNNLKTYMKIYMLSLFVLRFAETLLSQKGNQNGTYLQKDDIWEKFASI